MPCHWAYGSTGRARSIRSRAGLPVGDSRAGRRTGSAGTSGLSERTKSESCPWDRLTPATPQQGGELCKNVAWAQVDGCDHPLFPQGLLHHNIYWCFRTGVPQNMGQEAMIKCSKFTVGYQYGWGFAILSLIIRIEISESTVGIQSLPPSHLPPRYFSSVLGSRMTTLKKRRYSSKKLL